MIENKMLLRHLSNNSPFSMVKDLETNPTSFLSVKSFRYDVTVSMDANNSSAFFSWMLLWEDFLGDLFYDRWKHVVYESLIHTMPAHYHWHSYTQLYPHTLKVRTTSTCIFPNVPFSFHWKQLFSGEYQAVKGEKWGKWVNVRACSSYFQGVLMCILQLFLMLESLYFFVFSDSIKSEDWEEWFKWKHLLTSQFFITLWYV